jgi:glycerophosphoryl diester phosphodiesterase
MGTYVPLRITVTGSDLLFMRADTTGEAVTVADAAYRPVPVVHLGSAFAGVRFKNVELS